MLTTHRVSYTSKPFSIITSVVSLILISLVQRADAQSCSVSLTATTAQTQTAMSILFAPSTATAGTETSIVVTIPASAYFNFDTNPLTISENVNPALGLPSSFASGGPKLTLSKQPPTSLYSNVLTISNLATTTQPPNYSIALIGVTNPLSAKPISGITCGSYVGTTPFQTAQANMNSPIAITPSQTMTTGNSLSVQSNPKINGAMADLTFTLITSMGIPPNGGVKLTLPIRNMVYSVSANIMPMDPMLTTVAGVTFTCSFSFAGTTFQLGLISSQYLTSVITSQTNIIVFFSNTQLLPAGGTLTVTVSKVKLPPNTAPIFGFGIQTGETYFDSQINSKNIYVIETVSTQTTILQNDTPGSMIPSLCSLIMDPQATVGTPNVTYRFKVTIVNELPNQSHIQINFGKDLKLSTLQASQLTLSCDNSNCYTTQLTKLSIDPIANSIEIDSLQHIPYVAPGQVLAISISGFTNPETTDPVPVSFYTHYTLNGIDYSIDKLENTLFIQSQIGRCLVGLIQPIGDMRIYAVPQSYQVTMQSASPLHTDDGVRLVFPKNFYVIPNQRCIVTGQSANYVCRSFNTTNAVEIYNMPVQDMVPNQQFTFYINGTIMNPDNISPIPTPIMVTSITSSNKTRDTCSYAMPQGYFILSNITNFKVTPLDTGVGYYPASYRFEVWPQGDIWAYSSFVITMPPTITIYSQNDFQRACYTKNQVLKGFSNNLITCQTHDNLIFINQGFDVKGTSNTTQTIATDLTVRVPYIAFDLVGFVNPRSIEPSLPWNITIQDQYSRPYYYWQVPDSPTISMSGTAAPRFFMYTRDSAQNGNLTSFNFTVVTMNYLQDGDTLQIDLPYPVFASVDSSCVGLTSNLLPVLPCQVSNTLNQVKITLKLPIGWRLLEEHEEMRDETEDRKLQSVKRIQSNESFTFKILKVKNPPSFKPTDDAIQYSVFTENSFMIEHTAYSDKLRVNNTLRGVLDASQVSVIPSDFRQNVPANYTLSFNPLNYAQNMQIVITLPSQVQFSNSTMLCLGLQGSDKPQLNCTVDRKNRTITIKDAVTFQRGNPGTLKISLQLVNPTQNIITDSFKIETYTSDGYPLDSLTSGIIVNFYCQYPCMTCNQSNKTQCNSCYSPSDFEIWFDSSCIQQCPDGFVNTTSLNCTTCQFPCATCTNDDQTCTSCVEGYWKSVNGTHCWLKVYYPFPWFAMSVLFFILIVISEIVTKTESRFKESFIALIAIPEILSWITYIGLLFVTIEYKTWHFDNPFLAGMNLKGLATNKNIATMLACMGFLTYCLINLSHALVHPRKIVPNSMQTYKDLMIKHKCSTYFHQSISYIVSFKYSLILVSYMWNYPQYRGDYTEMNWTQFNRISFSFLFISYPLMMGSCAYYISSIGFWSYAGFAACEVVVVSTILAVLMLLDALSSIKCRTIGKAKPTNGAKVASGNDYESDEDEMPGKRALKNQKLAMKRRAMVAAGAADDDDSEVSFGQRQRNKEDLFEISAVGQSNSATAIMDDETRKQIAMLEELALQMKAEKEQIRIEKQRIENERLLILKERERQEQYLNAQVRDLETQKRSMMIQQAESRASNQSLIDKLNLASKQRDIKSFRNFESEMEDYEPVEEEKEEDSIEYHEQEIEGAQLPIKPAFEQIDYYRNMDGENQQWIKPVTPKRGGDSLMGQYETSSNYEYIPRKNAEYEVDNTVREKQDLQQRQFNAVPGAYSKMASQVMVNRSYESEIFDNRTDAAMEMDSYRHSKDTTEMRFFAKEPAVFDKISEKYEREESQQFIMKEEALNEQINQTSKHGDAHEFIQNEEAIYHQLDNKKQKISNEQQYISRTDRPVFSDVVQEKSINQDYFNLKTPQSFEAPSDLHKSKAADSEHFLARNSAAYGKQETMKSKIGTQHEFFANQEAFSGEIASAGRTVNGTSEQFFDKSDAEYGRSQYQRNKNKNEECAKESEDITGKSVSGESEVANHAPFNALTDLINLTNAQNSALFTPPPAHGVAKFKSIQGREEAHRKKKTIIYSDKSESSVDEMMADTPSNYNIPNGRFDGKSMGLKAVMLQAKKLGAQPLGAIQELPERQPIAINSQMFQRGSNFNTVQHEQQRQFVQSITGSRETGETWNASHPAATTYRTEEEEAQARRKKIPQTNKTFLEGNPGGNQKFNQANLTPQQQPNAARQLQFMKNNFI